MGVSPTFFEKKVGKENFQQKRLCEYFGYLQPGRGRRPRRPVAYKQISTNQMAALYVLPLPYEVVENHTVRVAVIFAQIPNGTTGRRGRRPLPDCG